MSPYKTQSFLCLENVQISHNVTLAPAPPPPWKGSQTPLTLSLRLTTTFLPALQLFFSFSPLALRNNVARSKISCGVIFRTQTAFSRPFMYDPLITGCLPGRGEIVISIPGFAAAKVGRVVRRKLLEGKG